MRIDARHFNILIVDDNPKNIQVLGSLLREEGYQIEFAIDGFSALEWIEGEEFDLILLDIMMPGMSGFEVCKKIISSDKNNDVPIIFLSAKTDYESIVEGFEIGAVDYITKPFNSKELLCRVHTHLDLRFQKKELLKANAEKDKFYSIVAHDIKNPFTSLITSMELFEQVFDKSDKDQLKPRLKKIKNDIDSIVSASTNLLQWAKHQSQKVEIYPIQLCLIDIVSEVAEFYNSSLSNKNIRLTIQISPQINVHFDRDQLGIVLRNLISNAIKFSQKDGEIILKAAKNEGHILLDIKDEGIGIPEHILNNLFDLSTKTTRLGTSNEKGTGLGMLLVREFVETNKAKLKIISKEGAGTQISLEFPDIN